MASFSINLASSYFFLILMYEWATLTILYLIKKLAIKLQVNIKSLWFVHCTPTPIICLGHSNSLKIGCINGLLG